MVDNTNPPQYDSSDPDDTMSSDAPDTNNSGYLIHDVDATGSPANDNDNASVDAYAKYRATAGNPDEASDNESETPDNAPNQHMLFPMDALPDLREGASADEMNSAQNKSRAEFTTVYDIIDSMEISLQEAKGSLFAPGTAKIDRDDFMEQLSTLKDKLPVQLERASSLMRESERRLQNAQSQSNAIISSAQSRAADMIKDAQDQAQFLAGQENVTELARQKARAILDAAQTKSDQLTQGANQYCATVMQSLQQQLGKFNHDVQAGIDVLSQRQQDAGEDLPHLIHDDYPED